MLKASFSRWSWKLTLTVIRVGGSGPGRLGLGNRELHPAWTSVVVPIGQLECAGISVEDKNLLAENQNGDRHTADRIVARTYPGPSGKWLLQFESIRNVRLYDLVPFRSQTEDGLRLAVAMTVTLMHDRG